MANHMTFLDEFKAGLIPFEPGAYHEYYVEEELEDVIPFWQYLGFDSQEHMDTMSAEFDKQ